MLKEDIIKLLEKAKDGEDVNSLLVGTDIETQFKGEEPTLDAFKSKVKSDKAFQQFMDSEKDVYHSKAIKTMKDKGTWESEFSDVINSKYPDLKPDPQAELKKELADLKAESAREKMLNQAIKYATEKKLPTDFVERFLGEDFDTTKTNLDGLADVWSKGLELSVNEKMKASSYVPGGKGADGKEISTGALIAQKNNESKVATSDPWASK